MIDLDALEVLDEAYPFAAAWAVVILVLDAADGTLSMGEVAARAQRATGGIVCKDQRTTRAALERLTHDKLTTEEETDDPRGTLLYSLTKRGTDVAAALRARFHRFLQKTAPPADGGGRV